MAVLMGPEAMYLLAIAVDFANHVCISPYERRNPHSVSLDMLHPSETLILVPHTIY